MKTLPVSDPFRQLRLSDGVVEEETEDMNQTFQPICYTSESHFFSQSDLNDLVSYLHLSKKEDELLGSKLEGWNLLKETTFFLSKFHLSLKYSWIKIKTTPSNKLINNKKK